MFTLISPGIRLDWDSTKDVSSLILKFLFLWPEHLSHLRKCDSWLLIWSKIFFVDKMAVFPYQTKSWIIPHLNHIRHCGGCVKSKPNQLILHFTTCKNHNSLCLTTERYKSHDHKNVILKKKHMDLTAHCTADSKVMTRRLVSRFNFSFFCRGPVSSCWAILKTKESSDGFWSHCCV